MRNPQNVVIVGIKITYIMIYNEGDIFSQNVLVIDTIGVKTFYVQTPFTPLSKSRYVQMTVAKFFRALRKILANRV